MTLIYPKQIKFYRKLKKTNINFLLISTEITETLLNL